MNKECYVTFSHELINDDIIYNDDNEKDIKFNNAYQLDYNEFFYCMVFNI